jgi:hypothetical protein
MLSNQVDQNKTTEAKPRKTPIPTTSLSQKKKKKERERETSQKKEIYITSIEMINELIYKN